MPVPAVGLLPPLVLCWMQGANSSILACRQKLIVVLTVDSGDSIANQELSFQLSCIGR